MSKLASISAVLIGGDGWDMLWFSREFELRSCKKEDTAAVFKGGEDDDGFDCREDEAKGGWWEWLLEVTFGNRGIMAGEIWRKT